MKTLTHFVIGTMIALGATAFIVSKSKPAAATPAHTTSANSVWFNTIEIADGITVEFEYGSQLQVFVEGDKNLTTQLAIVLENNILKASGKNSAAPVQNVKIKVVTPVLINLASLNTHTTHTSGNNIQKSISQASQKQVIVQPVLMQQQIFQVYTINA